MDRNKRARLDAQNKMNVADVRMKMRQLENYVVNTINGRYFMARCNMLSKQLSDKKIIETVDGNVKTEEYLTYEYMMSKHRAVKSFAYAWVAKKELMEKGASEEEIDKYLDSYMEKPIMRKEYSDIVDVDDQMPRFQ